MKCDKISEAYDCCSKNEVGKLEKVSDYDDNCDEKNTCSSLIQSHLNIDFQEEPSNDLDDKIKGNC